MESIFNALLGIGREGALFIVSMIPLIELRGAVPLGAVLGMNWALVYIICVIGNLIPVPFILLLGEKLLEWLKTTKTFGNFTRNYENKLMKKADKITKYSKLGLCMFVGIPVPGTGAWSGALLAVLLKIKPKQAFWSIALGVVVAGVIMTISSYGIVGAVKLF